MAKEHRRPGGMALNWHMKNCAFETTGLGQNCQTQRCSRLQINQHPKSETHSPWDVKKKKIKSGNNFGSGTKIISVLRPGPQHYLILVKNQERFPAGKCSQLRYPGSWSNGKKKKKNLAYKERQGHLREDEENKSVTDREKKVEFQSNAKPEPTSS